jgi:ABC-type amino acid transport system permease subunit
MCRTACSVNTICMLDELNNNLHIDRACTRVCQGMLAYKRKIVVLASVQLYILCVALHAALNTICMLDGYTTTCIDRQSSCDVCQSLCPTERKDSYWLAFVVYIMCRTACSVNTICMLDDLDNNLHR